jgi:hypothetical protein
VATTPVPLKVAVVLPPGLAVAVSVADRAPPACGVKLTATVQLCPGLSVIPTQKLAPPVKSPGFVPPMFVVIWPVIEVPTFVTVKACCTDDDPTVMLP